MTYVITDAHPDDAAVLGPLHLRNWLENYLSAEAGIDESWIREHRGSSATAEGVARWREFIEVANRRPAVADQRPAPHFCRVVRSSTRIVGYLCGRRVDGGVALGPMYLLPDAQGSGLGGRMMTEFFTWSGSAAVHLGVVEYNDRAIRFYQRHGFTIAGERYLWQGRLPTLPMAREARRTPAAGGAHT